MPKVFGLPVDVFAKQKPLPHSIVIGFATNIDRQYDPKLYNRLDNIYKSYDHAFQINVDDITKPHAGLYTCSAKDAEIIVKAIQRYRRHNIYVHCNAGVSRTGSVIKYILKYYPQFELASRQFQYSKNSLITKRLNEARKQII